MYSTLHMQGTSEFYPQYYSNVPTTFGQVPLNSCSPLLPNPDWQNMQVIDETTPKYYTQWYPSPSQGASTTCESEAEQEKMDHRRKTRRRKQRKSHVQPSQLNGSIPNDPRQYDSRPFYPFQPTIPLPTQVPTLPQQFHPWPRQEAGYHQERPKNGTRTSHLQEQDEDRKTQNGDSFNLGHLSQSVAMIHLLCCCATMLLCFSILLPLYCAALWQ